MSDPYDALLDANYSAPLFADYAAGMTAKSFATNSAYFQSVAIVVLCLYGTGIISIVLYWTGMLSRCYFLPCRGLPSIPTVRSETGKIVTSPWDSYRWWVEALFYSFAALTVAFSAYTVVGSHIVTRGVNTMVSSVNDFSVLIDEASVDGDRLYDYGVNLTALAHGGEETCVVLAAFKDDIDRSLESYMNTVQNLQDVTNKLDNMVGNIHNFYDYYADGAIFYCVFSVTVVSMIVLALFNRSERYEGMKVALGFNNFLYLIFITLGAVWCVITVVSGDFCKAPSHHIINALPAGGTVNNVTTYYATCYGTSELTVNLNKGVRTVNDFNTYLEIVQIPCFGNPYIEGMQFVVKEINVTLHDMYNITACPPIHNIYENIIYSGVCDDVMNGIFYIWGSQVFCAGLMFVVIVLGSFAYQFYLPVPDNFDSYKKVIPAHDEPGNGLVLQNLVLHRDDHFVSVASAPFEQKDDLEEEDV
eukprot:gene1937-2115_t